MYRQKILISGNVTVDIKNEISDFESLNLIKEDVEDKISMIDFGELEEIDYEIEGTYEKEAYVEIVGKTTINVPEREDYGEDYYDFPLSIDELVVQIDKGVLENNYSWEIDDEDDWY